MTSQSLQHMRLDPNGSSAAAKATLQVVATRGQLDGLLTLFLNRLLCGADHDASLSARLRY